MLQDFDIENEAAGVGKALIKQFPAGVSSNTLEIRFYWAGKGTTAIPYKSVYGPLISAISVGGLSSNSSVVAYLDGSSNTYGFCAIIEQNLQPDLKM